MSTLLLFGVVIQLAVQAPAVADSPTKYVIVVSQQTLDDPAWKPVVSALLAKHKGQVLAYDKLSDAKTELSKRLPKFACFVATPVEANKSFVAQVHQLTRQLDDDPYTDVIWGILTGFDAANALRIAETSEPLLIHKVAAGTDLPLELFDEGTCYSELEAGRIRNKPN